MTTYTYDRAQRLTNLTNVVGSTTITSHAYTLDSEGNRTAQTEFVSGITSGASDSFGYTYDGLNRLTAVTNTNAESFTLDSASNISNRTGPSATFSYDTSNRLTGDGGQTFNWSNADRLTGRGSDSFGYDPRDRLTSSTVSGTSRTYAYNADGLLQSRTQGGSTTSLLWDPATSPSRLLQVGSDKIVYGLGPLYFVSGSATTTFARDGGKSVRAELNGSGGVNASFRYKAYGAIAQSNGASAPSYLGYAGQLLDPSGLYYMRARWNDPRTGRFLSGDRLLGRLGEPISLNRFGYASANPVIKSDPSGLDPDSLLTSGGGGGGLEGAIPADSSLGGGGGLGVAIALGLSGAVVWIADLLTGGGSAANPQPSPGPGPRKSLTAGTSPRVITGDVINEVEESLAANDGVWTEQVRLVEEATSHAWRGGTNLEYVYKNSVTQERIVQHVIIDVDGQVVHVTWRGSVTWTFE